MRFKMFYNFIFIVVITTFNSLVYSSNFNDCLQYVGKYSKQIENNDTFSSQGLTINAYSKSSTLELIYNSDLDPSTWKGWIETYTADGNNHDGDFNTGKMYFALCDQNKIIIKRIGLLIKPLITEISFSDNQLYYLQYSEGNKERATFMKLKKVNEKFNNY